MKKQKQYTICIRLPSTQGSELVLRGLVEAHSRETLVDTPTRYTSPPRDTPTRDTDRDRDTARTPPVPTADYLSRRQLKLLGNLIVTNLNSAQGPTHPLGVWTLTKVRLKDSDFGQMTHPRPTPSPKRTFVRQVRSFFPQMTQTWVLDQNF